jgi:LacI family transcriptional regulator
MHAASALGRRLPDDLALVAFDDYPYYAFLSPALTAVSQPIHDLGQAAVDLLFALMEGRAPEVTSRVLPTQVVVRESCGAGRPRATPPA